MSGADESTETRVLLERVTTVLEFLRDGHEDHEARLRTQEQRPSGITPRQALATAGALAAIVATVTPIVASIH
jgi:hypothetical protein